MEGIYVSDTKEDERHDQYIARPDDGTAYAASGRHSRASTAHTADAATGRDERILPPELFGGREQAQPGVSAVCSRTV